MMVPWRLQKRFFQAGHSVSTPVQDPEEVERKKLEKKLRKRRLPKKGKVNNPLMKKVNEDTEVEIRGSDYVHDIQICSIEERIRVTEEEEEEEEEGEEEEGNKGMIKESIVINEQELINEVEKEVEIGTDEISPEGRCEHMKEEGDQLLFQRYCHVYQAGELEDLCSW